MVQWATQGKLGYLHGGSCKTLPLIPLQNTLKDQYFQGLVLKPRTMTAAWGHWAYTCASDVYKFLGCFSSAQLLLIRVGFSVMKNVVFIVNK